MLSMKKIPFFINNSRRSSLLEFRNLIIEYYDNVRSGGFLKPPIENQKSSKIRIQINNRIDKINSILIAADLDPTLIVTPPPAIGGRVQSINLLDNFFLLHIHQINPSNIIDFLDRGIGKYTNDNPYSIIRTLNPLYYLGLILYILGNIPFRLFEYAGFNVSPIEHSWFGKLIKFIIELAVFFASVLNIIYFLDINILNLLQNLFKSPN